MLSVCNVTLPVSSMLELMSIILLELKLRLVFKSLLTFTSKKLLELKLILLFKSLFAFVSMELLDSKLTELFTSMFPFTSIVLLFCNVIEELIVKSPFTSTCPSPVKDTIPEASILLCTSTLLSVINELFTYVIDPYSGKKVIRINPKFGLEMMGFPRNFIFPVSDNQAMKQLGNSVAVNVIKELGLKVEEHINLYLK
jgi:hypothetical protein